MDEPFSAYSYYKSRNKLNPKEDKKVKRKKNRSPTKKNTYHSMKEITVKEVANKMKFNKVNLKKKSHKKKKNKKKEVKIPDKPIKTMKTQLSEEIPAILPPVPVFSVPKESIEQIRTSSCGSYEFMPVQTDSVEEGLKVFKWMIAPYDPDVFLNRIWEKKPLHIARQKPNYYQDIITTPLIDNMLRNENIQFTKNIDITSYVDRKRETHNPEGRALPHLVWDYYLNGCSIRLLNPQTYMPKLHLVNATLQEFFNSFVGANAYLTPPDSQGFAPHFDDIEAFILQTEGKKHWQIYKPRTEKEVLPRVSSSNFDQTEIGEPVLKVTLEAGDMLYFPRGYIHQGFTIDGEHSLHVTVSMYQKHSWADLFEKMIPAALHLAIDENIELRHGLPFDIYDTFGLVNSDVNIPRKKEIEQIIKTLFDKIKHYLPIDEAVDQMAKNYQHDALPPVLTDQEKAVTVFGDSDVMIENGKVTHRVEIGLDTRIRLLRKNILRLVSEEGHIRLYYYVENSLEYHGNEPPYVEIEEELAPAIETLITTYPDYVAVEELDAPNESDKLQIADALWSRGLVMTEYPLENIED